MQPVLTHHTLNHLVLHLETEPANHTHTFNKGARVAMTEKQRSPSAHGYHGRFQCETFGDWFIARPWGRCVSHRVVWVWVRPAAGTINSKEVMTVFVLTVDLLLLLKHTHTLGHCWCDKQVSVTFVMCRLIRGQRYNEMYAQLYTAHVSSSF